MEMFLLTFAVPLVLAWLALAFADACTLYQRGERWDYTNSGSTKIETGDVVVLTNGVGICVGNDIAAGKTGVIDVEHVFEVPKTTGAWTQGQLIYWDASNGYATTTAGANNKMGLAAAAAETSASSGYVDLNKFD